MTTPFSSVPAPYAGATPTWPTPWPDRSVDVWLGAPGNMVQLPPADLIDPQLDGGEVVHGLYGGGQATTYGPNVTRQWTIEWPSLLGREWQLIYGFYRKAIAGRWPWCLITGEDINKLTAAQSLCGSVTGDASAWTTTAGSLAYAASQSSHVTPCGVMQFTPSAAGDLALPGTSTTPDAQRAIPYIPALFFGAYVWAWTASGSTTARLVLQGKGNSSTVVASVDGQDVTVGTTPTRVPVVAGPGAFGSSLYVGPALRAGGTSAVYFSNAFAGYVSDLSDGWELGSGAPRVSPTGPPTRDMSLWPSAAASWTFAETITGAA